VIRLTDDPAQRAFEDALYVSGGEIVFNRTFRGNVHVVTTWGSYLVSSSGAKLQFSQWDQSTQTFDAVAFYDMCLCITYFSYIKNFLLVGDIRKGLHFLRWKEERGRSITLLSRSMPNPPLTVLACNLTLINKTVGLVALDDFGDTHLFSFTPSDEQNNLLRRGGVFPVEQSVQLLRLQIEAMTLGLIVPTLRGSIQVLVPIDDKTYRVVTSLTGMLSLQLPHPGGLNPRIFRTALMGANLNRETKKNVDDGQLLRHLVWLSRPRQEEMAAMMATGLDELLKIAHVAADPLAGLSKI
jgi:cleavage and polyadenylation specificity factor subunit 1